MFLSTDLATTIRSFHVAAVESEKLEIKSRQ